MVKLFGSIIYISDLSGHDRRYDDVARGAYLFDTNYFAKPCVKRRIDIDYSIFIGVFSFKVVHSNLYDNVFISNGFVRVHLVNSEGFNLFTIDIFSQITSVFLISVMERDIMGV